MEWKGDRGMGMSTIERIQRWYLSKCNGDWEHTYGVRVETLDNPGWHVSIDLAGTNFEGKGLAPVEYGVGPGSEPEGTNWMSCKADGKTFHGYGGPEKLEEIFECFLEWDREDRGQSRSTD